MRQVGQPEFAFTLRRRMRYLVVMLVALTLAAKDSPEDYLKRQKATFITSVGKADEKLEEAKKTRDKEIKDAVETYVQALEKVKTHYTKRDELDEALAVRAEIQKMEKFLEGGKPIVAAESAGEGDVDGDEEPVADSKVEPERTKVSRSASKVLGYEVLARPAIKMRLGKLKSSSGSNYYAIIRDKMSWGKAQEHCKKLGGHLVTITSATEYAYIQKLLIRGKVSSCWFGGTDADEEGKWQWITGEPWKFTAWKGGEFSDYKTAEDHLAYYKGGWVDFRDSKRLWFICEWGTQ
jgi:hypothetical protein